MIRPDSRSSILRVFLFLAPMVLSGCGQGDGQITASTQAGQPTGPQSPPLMQGSALYTIYCSGCHAPDGTGSTSGGPPLAGSKWVGGPQKRLIAIVLHGVRGPIDVGGNTHNREMPGFGSILTDAQVAALLTGLRQRFSPHNALTAEPHTVAADTVAQVRRQYPDRQDYWTVEELLKMD